MKNAIAGFFALLSFNLSAQEFADPSLQSLIDAERGFSLMAKEKNTRDAFIYYLSDSAVTSVPGQGPRKGKKYLEEQTPNESWLYWYPIYSDISSSGDFGFNTGPWEFRQKKSDEKPVAFGEFVSMWTKNNKGEWKVAIDIGIGHPAPSASSAGLTTSLRPLKKSKEKKNARRDEIFSIEKQLQESLKNHGNSGYDKMLSNEVRVYRAGKEPIVGLQASKEFLTSTSSKVNYTFMGGDAASSGDLAYVYGKASFEIIKDGVAQTRNGSYMRFWKKEDGKNWKVVVDLITN